VQDRQIDARVLAVLSERDLVPAIWLPDPRVRCGREQARFRLHLVKHKFMLKHRVHSTMISFGHPCPVTDVFGVQGRRLLERLEIPDPWRRTVDANLDLIDYLESTMHALRHPAYAERYQRNKKRLGKQRGARVAQIDIARKLTEAIWHMLTNNQPFAPTPASGGAAFRLAA